MDFLLSRDTKGWTVGTRLLIIIYLRINFDESKDNPLGTQALKPLTRMIVEVLIEQLVNNAISYQYIMAAQ